MADPGWDIEGSKRGFGLGWMSQAGASGQPGAQLTLALGLRQP